MMADAVPGPAWIDDDRIAVVIGVQGRNLPYQVTTATEASDVLPMIDPDLPFVAPAIAVGGDTVVVAAAESGNAGDLWRLDDGRPRRITTEGSSWQRRFPHVELDGAHARWTGRSHPGVARLTRRCRQHAAGRPSSTSTAGPTGAWGPGGTLDAMALTAAGYRVLMPNIRGSTTFGAAVGQGPERPLGRGRCRGCPGGGGRPRGARPCRP